MPLKAFKCTADLTIHMLTAPGSRFANKEDLYLNVCLLGQQRRTRVVAPQFPLIFDDHLLFEKTFKFCRDPSDVVNLLSGLHIFIELIQLGRSPDTEVLATFEANAKDFLYPIPNAKLAYHSAQRDLFMTRSVEFPGSISPQLQFCTSTRIEETRTPTLDMHKEHQQRFVYDPLMDIKSKATRKRSGKRAASSNLTGSKSFMDHTICSAIKADFAKPDVKFKLSELNSSVDSYVFTKSPERRSKSPFVVSRVKDRLIGRVPGSHTVLNEGLILVRKSRNRSRKQTKSSQINALQQRENSLNRSFNESSLNNNEFRPKRLSRSHSPSQFKTSNESNQLNSSTNKSFNNPDDSKLFESTKRFDTNLENCSHCSNSHADCDLCQDYRYRVGKSFRGHRFHRDETKIDNEEAIFDKKDPFRTKSVAEILVENRHSNLPQYSPTLERRPLAERYGTKSAYEKKYPLNKSFSYYSPALSRYNWRHRYNPWYYTYADYLRDLEDELYWLKIRTQYL